MIHPIFAQIICFEISRIVLIKCLQSDSSKPPNIVWLASAIACYKLYDCFVIGQFVAGPEYFNSNGCANIYDGGGDDVSDLVGESAGYKPTACL